MEPFANFPTLLTEYEFHFFLLHISKPHWSYSVNGKQISSSSHTRTFYRKKVPLRKIPLSHSKPFKKLHAHIQPLEPVLPFQFLTPTTDFNSCQLSLMVNTLQTSIV